VVKNSSNIAKIFIKFGHNKFQCNFYIVTKSERKQMKIAKVIEKENRE